jgi:N-acetylmuramoyl-L-alanine amidase CwlA
VDLEILGSTSRIWEMIDINKWSRSGKKLKEVKAVVVHWVAKPMQSAENVKRYFSMLNDRYASTQYIIGLDGEVVQVMPENELAYHVGGEHYTPLSVELFGAENTSSRKSPNPFCIGIELCHTDWKGNFTKETEDKAVNLVASLCLKYNLNARTNVLRHFDITGKRCPRLFVENPAEWFRFKDKIEARMEELKKATAGIERE